MKYALALAPAALLVGDALATSVDVDFLRLREIIGKTFGVQKRDTIDPSQIAPQCQQVCALFVESYNDCPTNACLCQDNVMSSAATCLGCSAEAKGDTTGAAFADYQTTLNDLEDACASVGDPVHSFTVSLNNGGAAAPTPTPTSGQFTHSATPSGPVATSIFFSTPGGGLPSNTIVTTAPSSVPSAPVQPPPPISHNTISVITPGTPPNQPSPSSPNTPAPSPSLNPPGPPSTHSGAFRAMSAVSGVTMAGVVGIAMFFVL